MQTDQAKAGRKRRSTRVSDSVHQKRPKPGPPAASTPDSADAGQASDLHPTLRGCPGGRQYTLSIAVPGSVLLKQPTLELKTLLASRIARAAAVYCVDEIVVFDETCSLPTVPGSAGSLVDSRRAFMERTEQPAVHLALLLQYLECPQYLRRRFFPHQDALARAGVCDPLALPSHVAANERSPYREGAVVQREDESWVQADIGLRSLVAVFSAEAPVGARITVRMPRREGGEYRLVAPYLPRRKRGIYWGYSVRLVNGLSGVMRGCPFVEEDEECGVDVPRRRRRQNGDSGEGEEEEEEEDRSDAEEEEEEEEEGGYDLILGTSERGTPVEDYEMPVFRHLLVVFGGPDGLETSLEMDESLVQTDPRCLFPAYLNTCNDQGSRTIRTEEAIIVSLAALRTQIKAKGIT